MGRKLSVFLVGSYVFAMGVNLLPALFYPDSDFTPWMIGLSAMFLILLGVAINRMPLFGKGNFVMTVFFFVASIGCVFIFVVNALGWTWSEAVILNVLSNGQFLFYFPFVTPLFGLNYFFELPFYMFSLLVGGFYFVVAVSVLIHKKGLLKKMAREGGAIR